jgi:hypothetical protein
MNVHKNASMTPKGRAHLVQQIDLVGRTARKWHARHAAQGSAGLLDWRCPVFADTRSL